MLLTITTTHRPATDLGFLLMKNPANVHKATLPFGTATLFYPEASEERCTAAITLDVDTIELVRGKAGLEDQYVNDRPYAASAALEAARARGVDVGAMADAAIRRRDDALLYRAAYNRYVAPFAGIDDLRIAPFHLLSSEGAVHDDKDHLWHMAQAHRLAAADPALLVATAHRRVDLADPAQVAEAIVWWETLTAAGGEGVVVKPLDFVARGGRGLLQPAIKCRGREYLRIIYGPDYDRPDNLARLKKRGLGQKRSMALREFALGLEALHRFVEHAPLTRVHQCVFGVLAMESEPVDPRL